MADDSEATTDVLNGDMDDPRDVCDVLNYAVETDDDFDIRLHGNFTPEEADEISRALNHAIGHVRTIVGNQKYIPGRVYYNMVSTFTDECVDIFENNPRWANGLSDEEMLLEVIMPSKIADTHDARQFVNMWVCHYSNHTDRALSTINLDEYQSFTTLQSDVALYAMMHDVANRLRRRHDISIQL